jgi:hypothetical protein
MSTIFTTQNFATYLRTKMFWRLRLKNVEYKEPIHIPKDQLTQVDLKALSAAGEIAITKQKTKKGHEAFYYVALMPGPIAPYLLSPPIGEKLDELTKEMRSYLKRVSLKEGSGSTDYFNVFLELKNEYLDLFFTVDLFSGRVHTPISGFQREYRPNILIDGEQTSSLDVATMQPLLLGKILEDRIGVNEYSQWIAEGKDIYLSIQDKAKLESRDKAKKRFFEILFSYADKRLALMFGNASWINWINEFKSKPLKANPHTMEKQHSNLAWLLQTTEVKIMREVWQGLHDAGIVFLSVHDEVIVKTKHIADAELIFSNILSKYFRYYKLCSKHPTTEPQAISSSLIADGELLPSTGETAVNSLKIGNNASFPPLTDNRVNLDEILRYMETIPEPSGPVRFAGGITITEPMQYINYQYQALKSTNGNPTASAPYELLKRIVELCKYQKLTENAI